MIEVNRDSLSVFVTAHLREQIFLRRSYSPGDYIRELDLSAELGVSRGPIRDAIKNLAAEGVLVVSPWKGAQVTSLTAAEREDIRGLCGVLEDRLAALLRQKGAPDAAAAGELQSLAGEMKRLSGMDSLEAREQLAELEGRFHDRLFQLAGRPWTEKALRGAYSQRALARLNLSKKAAAEETAQSCLALLEKIQRPR